MGKRKTFKQTIDDLLQLPINCAQFYLSSSRSYSCPKPDINDMLSAREKIEYYKLKVFVHACLLYNLYGCTNPKDANYTRNLNLTRANLINELDMCVCMSMVGAVVHIGSSKLKEQSIPRISKTVTEALTLPSEYTEMIAEGLNINIEDVVKRRTIILENAAGEGNKIGSTLNEIKQIIDGVDESVRHQVKVCIDTAHIYGAGQYELHTIEGMTFMLDEIDRILGANRVALFHLNDSDLPFGSKRDSHMNLFRGQIFAQELVEIPLSKEERKKTKKRWCELSIGEEGIMRLTALVSYAHKNKIPLIVESPSSSVPDISFVKFIGTQITL